MTVAATAFGAEIELTQLLQAESSYRFSGGFDVSRTLVQIAAKKNIGVVETHAEVWAWKNFSALNYGLTDSEVALRGLRASYWGDSAGLSVGLQEAHWGETFGFQASDILQARNFRDFAFLDHGRNRIPAVLLKADWNLGWVKLQGIANPKGEVPILPETLSGVRVVNREQNKEWLVHPEFGMRASVPLDGANVDAFVYRHLARTPDLFPRLTPNGPELVASYDPVLSTGMAFSKSLSDFVVRGDAIVTFPAVHNVVLGTDWTPGDLIEGFTAAVQAQTDRAKGSPRNNYGLSLLLRKTLFSDKIEVEGQGYASVITQDRWVQGAIKGRFGNAWDAKVGVEWVSADPTSPLALFSGLSRVSSQVGYTF